METQIGVGNEGGRRAVGTYENADRATPIQWSVGDYNSERKEASRASSEETEPPGLERVLDRVTEKSFFSSSSSFSSFSRLAYLITQNAPSAYTLLEGVPLDVSMRRGFSIVRLVSSGSTGLAVANARVQFADRDAPFDHECFTTITPGRCWVCCCLWNWRNSACSSRCFAVGDAPDVVVVDLLDVFAVCLLVNASGTSCAGSSLNRWSPSRWRIASTIVSRFCREVLAR